MRLSLTIRCRCGVVLFPGLSPARHSSFHCVSASLLTSAWMDFFVGFVLGMFRSGGFHGVTSSMSWVSRGNSTKMFSRFDKYAIFLFSAVAFFAFAIHRLRGVCCQAIAFLRWLRGSLFAASTMLVVWQTRAPLPQLGLFSSIQSLPSWLTFVR